MTILADVEQTEVEVRCPVPKPLPGGDCRPGKLLLKLRLNGEQPSYVHPDNLIELVCADCREFARQLGRPVKRVLHRYDLAGNLCETLTEELGSPAGGGQFMPTRKGNVRRLPTRRTEDQELTVILNDMPDEEVRCRMRGRHRYAMDTVLPGQPWPDVIRAWPGKLGVFRIEDPCVDCELAWRVIETGVNGDMTGDLVITTHYDALWVTVPQGYGRTSPRRMRKEYNRRGGKRQSAQLSKVVSRTASEERRLARQRAKEAAEEAPQARFSSGAEVS